MSQEDDTPYNAHNSKPWPNNPNLQWHDLWANQQFGQILLAFAQNFAAQNPGSGGIEEMQIRPGGSDGSFMIKVGCQPAQIASSASISEVADE